jgi:orotidine-5'-phosphate decarboxylase
LNPLILALDTDDLDTACSWIEATNDSIKTYKAGLEFFLTFGESGIAKLRSAGDFDLFLDLKLHDIPNTVASATKAISHIQPKFLTVHASGGFEMISAAVAAAPTIDITAVTILTSLSAENVHAIGYSQPPLESAINLAALAVSAGARAIVCSPLEVSAIRERIGAEPAIITPGVRPAGSSLGDQNRVMTPRDAIAAGSTYLVIGRPITSVYGEGLDAMSAKAREILDDATSA